MKQIKAKIGPVTFNEKKVEVKFLFPEDVDPKVIMPLFKRKGQHALIDLQDPQISIDDYDDMDEYEEARQEDARRREYLEARQGTSGTIDERGVVEVNKKPEDENQVNLEDVQQENAAESEPSETEGSENSGEDGTGEPDPSPDGDSLESELETNSNTIQEDVPTDGIYEPSTKEVDEYILTNDPMYEDIPYSAAELLKRRKESNETWLEVASSFGVAKRVIESAVSEVRKRVKKILIEERRAA